MIKPVKSVGGSLQKYAVKKGSFKEIRDRVWKDVANNNARKNPA